MNPLPKREPEQQHQHVPASPPAYPAPEWHDFRPEFRYANTYERWKQRLWMLGMMSLIAMLTLRIITLSATMPGSIRLWYAAPVIALASGLVALALYRRRMQRLILSGRDLPCPGCGYAVGDDSPCPECGSALTRGQRKLAWRDAGYRDW